MTLKLGMQRRLLKYIQICSTDDPVLTMTYFTAMSNLVPSAFVWVEGKTMEFSETVVVYDIKIGRFRQLNEHVNLDEFQRLMSLIVLHSR